VGRGIGQGDARGAGWCGVVWRGVVWFGEVWWGERACEAWRRRLGWVGVAGGWAEGVRRLGRVCGGAPRLAKAASSGAPHQTNKADRVPQVYARGLNTI
jgi:hypothetical protein